MLYDARRQRYLCFWGSCAVFPCQAFFLWDVPFHARGLEPLAVPQAAHRTCHQHCCCFPGQYTAVTQQAPPSLLQKNNFFCLEQSPLPYSPMHRERPHLEAAQQGARNILSRRHKKRAAPGCSSATARCPPALTPAGMGDLAKEGWRCLQLQGRKRPGAKAVWDLGSCLPGSSTWSAHTEQVRCSQPLYANPYEPPISYSACNDPGQLPHLISWVLLLLEGTGFVWFNSYKSRIKQRKYQLRGVPLKRHVLHRNRYSGSLFPGYSHISPCSTHTNFSPAPQDVSP